MDDPLVSDDEVLPEERAREIWRRAARLQAEAAERLERYTRERARLSDGAVPEGYRVSELEAAAADAGIAPEFVRLALAEATMEERRGARLSPRWDRVASWLTGTDRRQVEVSRVIAAPPEAVFAAMQRVLPEHPYRLDLRETIGNDPLNGAVLVFGAPPYTGALLNEFALDLAYGGLKELHVVLRPVRTGDADVASEVTITSDLVRGRRTNLYAGGGVVAATAAGGGAFATAIAAASGLSLALAALPVAAGVSLGGAAFGFGWRALYRWGLGRATAALDRLLRALDGNTRTGGAFRSPAPPDWQVKLPGT